MTGVQLEGLVLKNYGGFYYVQDKTLNIHECKIRGKVKERILSGDQVVISPLTNGQGILEKVLPRRNELYRPRVANISQVLIVMAHDRPRPNLMLLDRLLVLSAYSRITPCIILNKCDLPGNPEVDKILAYYPDHYKLIKTSAKSKIGLEQLTDVTKDEIAVFSGPSGAGKSTLLNQMVPDIEARTQEVSSKIGRGRHTTRHVELFPLPQGGWIVDTPGFSSLDMPPLKRDELGGCFADFSEYAHECRFRDCLHYKESECGVKEAVQKKLVPRSRYDNYIAMLEEVISNERCY